MTNRASIIIICLTMLLGSRMHAQQQDWRAVEAVFDRQGIHQGDMLKMTFPRTELKVVVGDVTISPDLALTSWAAFKPMAGGAMMMGDLTLLESEVPAVMRALASQGIEITALHNHLLNERPTVMYMHFRCLGAAAKLAAALKAALSETSTPLAAAPPSAPKLDWSRVESILGYTGSHKGSVLQMGIPRRSATVENGMEIPPFMGMANAINFQTVGSKAAITGDFILVAAEVNPVLRVLTTHGIAVTALHSHMLEESPRLFFMHFWAVGDPAVLAQALHEALEDIDLKKP